MKKLLSLLISLGLLFGNIPVAAADELADLKVQVQQLMSRIETLEQGCRLPQ